MLVLSRKVGESVYAGPVKVIVTAVDGNTVKLGFEAGPETPVRRGELRPKPRPPLADASCEVELVAVEFVDAPDVELVASSSCGGGDE